jgi:hypothetical protein
MAGNNTACAQIIKFVLEAKGYLGIKILAF